MAEEVTIEYLYGGSEPTTVVNHTEPIVFQRTEVGGENGPSYHYLARVSPEVARVLSGMRLYRVWEGHPHSEAPAAQDGGAVVLEAPLSGDEGAEASGPGPGPQEGGESGADGESAASDGPEEPLPTEAEVDAAIRQASELKKEVLLDYADAHDLKAVGVRSTKGEVLEAIRAHVAQSLPGYRDLQLLLALPPQGSAE